MISESENPWQERYREKIRSPEEPVSVVRPAGFVDLPFAPDGVVDDECDRGRVHARVLVRLHVRAARAGEPDHVGPVRGRSPHSRVIPQSAVVRQHQRVAVPVVQAHHLVRLTRDQPIARQAPAVLWQWVSFNVSEVSETNRGWTCGPQHATVRHA